MKKVKLKDLWKSKEKIAIHCNTLDKATRLLRSLHLLGFSWCNGDSYFNNIEWCQYFEDTCYSNSKEYASYQYYKRCGIKIYEFEEIDDILLRSDNDESNNDESNNQN